MTETVAAAHLVRLTLTDFRSYPHAEVAAGPGLVAVTGDNGAGKTNLLESISLLAPGRGLRGAALSEAARSGGAGGFAVTAELMTTGGAVAIGTGVAASAPDRRLLRINGATAPASALAEWLSVLWLTPAMDRLFSDSPGARRRFLDRLVMALKPEHGRHITRYEAAMRERNRLLATERPDPDWLTALEISMAEHAVPISAARFETIKDLVRAIWEAPESPFPRVRLMLENSVNGHFLATRLAASRATHAAAGRTLLGPQSENLLVTHAEKDQPASRGSTGEQKALLIGIILAHAGLVAARTGRLPILLLDEVAAHLDPGRRAALFERLADTGAQVWMTGTEAALFDGLDALQLRVAGGAILA